ncbi:ATP-grasp domain-containing protein [Legionella yabuuchiae]|uniref:ATP-grasp domain-containing protein n=1 Tax=Legionella yabuuchiae TaxID=376727 RepID=UPI0010546167|nr:ATP-grasp domain-containing protein [Legionella yabuuchiae]
MSQLATFISSSHRPEINGGRLDKSHQPFVEIDYSNVKDMPDLFVNTIAFGPKKDKVLLNLEHAIDEKDKILVFYYEDLHKKWTYIQNNSESYFIYRKNDIEQFKIHPRNLYIRGCQIDRADPYWMMMGEFYNFVDTWEGRVICAPKQQHNNESKLYQLNSSLREASKHHDNISIGKSYVIKGKNGLANLPSNKSYIVKSLSGIRSIVVDDADFFSWKQASLSNIPTLFQEKVKGNDLRVHVVNKKVYGKLSLEKVSVDYRYDDNFFSLIDFKEFSDELKAFCFAVTENEENTLMGIDFIKSDSGYVVLEANPSPGWSAYHESNGIENDSFMDDLLKELIR